MTTHRQAAESRVHDRLALDTAAELPEAAADSPGEHPPAAEPEPQDLAPTTRTPTDTGPRHRRDRDDPDNLARWVGSLGDGSAAEEDDGGLPRRVPRSGVAGYTGDLRPEALQAASEAEHAEEEPAAPAGPITRGELIDRLDALATLVRIGEASVDPGTVERARALLDHAGTRLRLSTDHTVVALAGGTGSGKSSLFNALCGLELSQVAVTRPTTAVPHACVWGNRGAEQLLDWLEVPPHFRHSRSSELDPDSDDLIGLILLDTPDHDSVQTAHTAHAERLLAAADVIVWVLDPQKYADAAVHHRYLADLTGHSAVMVAVINQVDRLSESEAEDCVDDLRRLLEQDDVTPPQILTSSALTGAGISDLRQYLATTVAERRASLDRLVADLEGLSAEFAQYADPAPHDRPSWEPIGQGIADHERDTLFGYVATASGVTAVASAVETDFEQRGSQRVAWPLSRLFHRVRRDPLRAIRTDFERARGGIEGSVGVQWPEVESAIDEAADSASTGLPDGWPARVRAAAKSHAPQLPDLLGAAVAAAVPPPDERPRWWSWVRGAQFALLGVSILALAWLGVAAVSGVLGRAVLPGALHPTLMIFAAALVLAALVAGLLLYLGSRNLIGLASVRLRESVEDAGQRHVAEVVSQYVLTPLHQELERYQRFTEALRNVRGTG